MRFHQNPREDTPEINLIPLIDVLLVVLIFLAASTSFVHSTQLQLRLPQAQGEDATATQPMTLTIHQDGQYALNDVWLPEARLDDLVQALRQTAQDQEGEPTLVIYADAKSMHENVVLALQAARAAGIARLSFATQRGP